RRSGVGTPGPRPRRGAVPGSTHSKRWVEGLTELPAPGCAKRCQEVRPGVASAGGFVGFVASGFSDEPPVDPLLGDLNGRTAFRWTHGRGEKTWPTKACRKWPNVDIQGSDVLLFSYSDGDGRAIHAPFPLLIPLSPPQPGAPCAPGTQEDQ